MNKNKKHSNLLRIFDLIIRKGHISRIDLAGQMGLTRAAISGLTEELRGKGLIREAGTGETRGGRPPTLLEPEPLGCCFLGAAIFNFSWAIVLLDLSGNILSQSIKVIPEMTPECAVSTLKEAIDKLEIPKGVHKILPRIGIGTPGLVDSKEGIIHSAVDVGWHSVPLASWLTTELDRPCTIVNRSKVSALTAYYLNNPENLGNIISIVIGTGVASGIIIDHKLYMGSSYGAGELGHTSIIPNGPLCRCGNRGCLQALIGEEAILERGRNLAHLNGNRKPENISDILKQAEEGAPYHHVIEEVAEYLSLSLGNMINLLNPDRIVLSGPVITECPSLSDLVTRKTRYRAMQPNLAAVKIETSRSGIHTAAIGSALMVREITEEILSFIQNQPP